MPHAVSAFVFGVQLGAQFMARDCLFCKWAEQLAVSIQHVGRKAFAPQA